MKKIGLASKIIFMVSILFAITGVVCLLFYWTGFGQLKNFFVKKIIDDKYFQYQKMLSQEEEKVKIGSILLSKSHFIEEAYQMDDETQGRAFLRKEVSPTIQSIKDALNLKDCNVHFHKPPAKSFLREWRPAGDKDGGDDISAFRKAILKVYETRKPVSGIEVGVAAFEIRGIAPILDSQNNYIGSVEFMSNFNSMLKKIKADKNDDFMILMKGEHTSIAKGLANSRKIGNYIIVNSTNDNVFANMNPQVIDKNIENFSIDLTDSNNIYSFFPIKDFSGKVIGSIVYFYNPIVSYALINNIFIKIFLYLGIIGILGLVAIFFFTSFLLKGLTLINNKFIEFSKGEDRPYDFSAS